VVRKAQLICRRCAKRSSWYCRQCSSASVLVVLCSPNTGRTCREEHQGLRGRREGIERLLTLLSAFLLEYSRQLTFSRHCRRLSDCGSKISNSPRCGRRFVATNETRGLIQGSQVRCNLRILRAEGGPENKT